MSSVDAKPRRGKGEQATRVIVRAVHAGGFGAAWRLDEELPALGDARAGRRGQGCRVLVRSPVCAALLLQKIIIITTDSNIDTDNLPLSIY